jgi:hypothetical protein
MDTKSILAELEDLGATGVTPPVTPTVEKVQVQRGRVAPVSLDERGAKMARLADIVIGELDTLVVAASSMRDALTEMKDIWSPVITEDGTEALEASQGQEIYDDVDNSWVEEDEIEDEVESENLQGSPNAMGDISLSVPPPVPLPGHIADLPD